MAHYAKLDNTNRVINIIVADAAFIETRPGTWVQTSYNTRGGVHYGPDGKPDGGYPLRKNYAMINGTYDEERDAFIPPKVYPSWVLNEQTCLWEPPIPYPADENNYTWNESSQNWTLIPALSGI